MRFLFSGPRIFGIRTGVLLGREDWRALTRTRATAPAIDPDHGFIYVIKGDNGRCKIGITTNPNVRLAQLQTASSTPLEFAWVGAPKEDTIAIERDVHQMLDQYRRSGEWFELKPDAAVGAIHAVAFKRGLPVLDLTPEQAEKIRQVAEATNPAQSEPLFRQITNTIIFAIFGAVAFLMIWVAAWQQWGH